MPGSGRPVGSTYGSEVIVWVASFPRSGNTFLRIVLHRRYGVRTSTVYDIDGVARRLGPDLVGYEDRRGSIAAMRDDEALHFVKTHRPRDDQAQHADRAICLVRDGRDALVSWAHQRIERVAGSFDDELRARIEQPGDVGAGSWGHNVLSWLTPSAAHRLVLRYEDLVDSPVTALDPIMKALAPQRRAIDNAPIPSFAELRQIDAQFFRRGHRGTHHYEMSDELQRRFWARPENVAAMALLGVSA